MFIQILYFKNILTIFVLKKIKILTKLFLKNQKTNGTILILRK